MAVKVGQKKCLLLSYNPDSHIPEPQTVLSSPRLCTEQMIQFRIRRWGQRLQLIGVCVKVQNIIDRKLCMDYFIDNSICLTLVLFCLSSGWHHLCVSTCDHLWFVVLVGGFAGADVARNQGQETSRNDKRRRVFKQRKPRASRGHDDCRWASRNGCSVSGFRGI